MAGTLACDDGHRAALAAVARMNRMLGSAETDPHLLIVLRSAQAVLQTAQDDTKDFATEIFEASVVRKSAPKTPAQFMASLNGSIRTGRTRPAGHTHRVTATKR